MIEFANCIIKSNDGGKICIGDTTYLLLFVSCHNTTLGQQSHDAALTLHLKVYKNDGTNSDIMRATTSISKLIVDDDTACKSSKDLEIIVKVRNIERVSRMIVYYSLLSIAMVCENLETVEKVLSASRGQSTDSARAFALIPSMFAEDIQYQENTRRSIVYEIQIISISNCRFAN